MEPSDRIPLESTGSGPVSGSAFGRAFGGEVRVRHSAHRLFRTFLAARAALGVALLGVHALSSLVSGRDHPYLLVISSAYAALAVTAWLWPGLSRRSGHDDSLALHQGLATIGLDLFAFGAMHLLADPGSFSHAALLLLPVLMAGLLTSRPVALGVALIATAELLLRASASSLHRPELASLISQAGLAGIGFLILSTLMQQLAQRLARDAQVARGSIEAARQQVELNRLVIEEMAEGVMVVDRQGRVRASNPAARSLLDVETVQGPAAARGGGFLLQGVPAWTALVEAMETAFSQGGLWPVGGRPVALSFTPDRRVQVQLRMRFTRRQGRGNDEDVCVLFLEDLRDLQARQRQDKLAAMGRVSAGIAHEIRNPLAAIAQANALLGEDATQPAQRRLTQMVADNVERLKRIVDDVMEVAPGDMVPSLPIDLVAELRTICIEWAATCSVDLEGDGPVRLELPAAGRSITVLFDVHHLRRVLVNLLDNAHRHASGLPGGTRVRLTTEEGLAVLSVASDGEPIGAEVEPFLFEPFFSTRSRGTGLGLYICRELCERHRASLEFRAAPPGTRHANEFRLTLPQVQAAASLMPA